MRVYKIINAEKLTKAKDFLTELKNQRKQNIDTINSTITPFKWAEYLESSGGFNLLPTYLGFKPKQKLKEIPEGWKIDKDYPGILSPYRRSKAGRMIAKKIEELPNYSFQKIAHVLDVKIKCIGRFLIPSLRISKNKKHVFLIVDSKVKLNKKDFKEVTISYANKKLGIKE
jgi:hypothetical protein